MIVYGKGWHTRGQGGSRGSRGAPGVHQGAPGATRLLLTPKWVIKQQNNGSKPWLKVPQVCHGQMALTSQCEMSPHLLFFCFITNFGVGSSLVTPGAPWCTPGDPLVPLEPPWPLVCHPLPYTIILGHYGSYLTHLEWIIQAFALQYIALHCSAL